MTNVTKNEEIFRDPNKNFDGKNSIEKVKVKEFLREGAEKTNRNNRP